MNIGEGRHRMCELSPDRHTSNMLGCRGGGKLSGVISRRVGGGSLLGRWLQKGSGGGGRAGDGSGPDCRELGCVGLAFESVK